VAETARGELRQSILNLWPSELTAERFSADLHRYVRDYCRGGGLILEVSVRGDFARLPAGVRRSLYRIAQEALVNIARHAAASRADICLEVRPAEVALAVRDDGRGFDPATALTREHGREHFGLRSIQERAAALGGEAEFLSQPSGGTTVLVTLPVDGAARG
jgi:signal transduction histidine kinase